MKILKKITLIMLVALLAIACKSDDDGGDNPSGGEGTLTAKVAGASYTATFGITARLSGSGANQALAVSGGTENSENLQVIIQGFDGVGTYDLSFLNIGTYTILTDINNPMSAVVYSTVGNGQTVNGELKVSSFDGNKIQGTFNFKAINLDDPNDIKQVTDGQFNIEVTNQ